MVLQTTKMKNLFELIAAMLVAILLIASLPFLMINDATAIID